MRWVLFDVVVGAALVWLVWDGRGAEQSVPMVPPAASAVSAALPLPEGPPLAPSGRPAPEPDTSERVSPQPAAATAPAAPPTETAGRGQQLRALARDAEALFLRGGE